MNKKHTASAAPVAPVAPSVALVSGNDAQPGANVADRVWIKSQTHPRGGFWLTSSRLPFAEVQRQHERDGKRLLEAGRR